MEGVLLETDWRPEQTRVTRRGTLAFAAGCVAASRSTWGRTAPQRRVEIAWRGVPLRPRLRAFANQQGWHLFLDRRIDPDQELDIELSKPLVPLRALDHIADSVGAVVVPVDDVLIVAPPGPADAIDSWRQQLERGIRGQWPNVAKRQAALQWNDGASSRAVVQRAADRFEITLANLDAVPHDIWPGYTFPPLGADALFTIVLSGFDLTVKPMPSKRARVVQARLPGMATRWMAVPHLPPTITSLKKNFPEIRWTRKGKWFIATGNSKRVAAAADYLRQWDLQSEASAAGGSRQLYTLTVENQPVGAILRTLEVRGGLRFDIDPACAEKLKQRVSFEVSRVPLRTLLKRTLEPVGLKFQVADDKIHIRPRLQPSEGRQNSGSEAPR